MQTAGVPAPGQGRREQIESGSIDRSDQPSAHPDAAQIDDLHQALVVDQREPKTEDREAVSFKDRENMIARGFVGDPHHRERDRRRPGSAGKQSTAEGKHRGAAGGRQQGGKEPHRRQRAAGQRG